MDLQGGAICAGPEANILRRRRLARTATCKCDQNEQTQGNHEIELVIIKGEVIVRGMFHRLSPCHDSQRTLATERFEIDFVLQTLI